MSATGPAPDPWPSGTEDLRADLDTLFRSSAYLARVGGTVDEWGLGWARVRCIPGAEASNISGTVHGGVIVGLADVAFEIACNSYGRQAVALELGCYFLRPARTDVTLVAEANEINLTRRTGVYRIEVRETSGTLIASLKALAYRSDTWRFDENRYPDGWKQTY